MNLLSNRIITVLWAACALGLTACGGEAGEDEGGAATAGAAGAAGQGGSSGNPAGSSGAGGAAGGNGPGGAGGAGGAGGGSPQGGSVSGEIFGKPFAVKTFVASAQSYDKHINATVATLVWLDFEAADRCSFLTGTISQCGTHRIYVMLQSRAPEGQAPGPLAVGDYPWITEKDPVPTGNSASLVYEEVGGNASSGSNCPASAGLLETAASGGVTLTRIDQAGVEGSFSLDGPGSMATGPFSAELCPGG